MSTAGFWFEGGRISLDFIATNGARCGEMLPAPESVAAWLVAGGLTEQQLEVSATELTETHALRAALLRLIQASMGGGGVRPGDVQVINAAAAREAPLQLLVLRDGDLVGREPAPRVRQCLGVIARDAIDLLTGPHRLLLRRCADDTCSGIYVDLSRGGRRKWCTSAGCGNRARVSAHRSQRRTVIPPRTEGGE